MPTQQPAPNWPPDSYIPPAPMPSPSLTFLDAHEMADLIRRAMTSSNAAGIAAHMENTRISGQDFLNLSLPSLESLSENNEQAFRELQDIQRITPIGINSLLNRSPLIKRVFPGLAPLIHYRQFPSGSIDIGNVTDHLSNDPGLFMQMLGTQVPQESFSHEALDHSDDEEEVTLNNPPAVAIVDGTSLSPLFVDPGVAVPQDVLSPFSFSLQLEDDQHLSSPTFSNLQNDLAIAAAIVGVEDASIHGLDDSGLDDSDLAGPDSLPHPQPHSTPNTRSFSPALSYIDEGLDAAAQRLETTLHAPSTIGVAIPQDNLSPLCLSLQLEESSLASSIFFNLGDEISVSDEDPHNTGSLSPLLSYTDEDLDVATRPLEMISDGNVPNPNTSSDSNMLLEQDRLPINVRHLTSDSEFLGRSQLESWLTLPLNYLQRLLNDPALITEDEGAFEPPCPLTSEPVATLSASLAILGYTRFDLSSFWDIFCPPDLRLSHPISENRFDVGEANNGQTLPSSDTLEETIDHEIDSPRCLEIYSEDSLTLNSALESTESYVSTNETLQSFVGGTSSNMSLSCSSLEVHDDFNFDISSESGSDLHSLQDTDDLNERSDVDMNIPASIHGTTIILPIDTVLPLIPVTPSSSPIFEGLSRYMLELENGDDRPSPSEISESTPGLDVNIAVQPDLVCPHLLSRVQTRDSYLGMLNGGLSPFQRICLG